MDRQASRDLDDHIEGNSDDKDDFGRCAPPQVGDTVRLTMFIEGPVTADRHDPGRLYVEGYDIDSPQRTVEVLSRATPPLPSEPGTWWLDSDDDVWQVMANGVPVCLVNRRADPAFYAPFRQLVLKP